MPERSDPRITAFHAGAASEKPADSFPRPLGVTPEAATPSALSNAADAEYEQHISVLRELTIALADEGNRYRIYLQEILRNGDSLSQSLARRALDGE